MTEFSVNYSFNEKAIKRVAKMQMNIFCAKFQIAFLCAGILCAYLGIFVVDESVVRFVLLGIGCYLFTMQWYPQWEEVKRAKKLFGEGYPQCRINFSKDKIEAISLNKRDIAYDEISRLIHTGMDIFLLTKDKVLLYIPKDSLKNRKDFENFITGVTGLEWTKQRGILKY